MCDTYKNDDTLSETSSCFSGKYNSEKKVFDVKINGCLEKNNRCRNIPVRSLWGTTDFTVKCTLRTFVSDTEITSNYTLLPGEICKNNYECKSNKCSVEEGFTTYCDGNDEGQSCSVSDECKSKLYCDTITGKCKAQNKEGTACTKDEQCVNYAGCYKGNCTSYWSIENGVAVDSADSQYCKSDYVYDNKCQEFNLLYTNNNTQTFDCTESGQCTYFLPLKNDIITLSDGYCNCGYNGDGKAYCRHGSNAVTHQDHISEKKSILSYPKESSSYYLPKCHVSKKYSCNNVNIRQIQLVRYLEYAKMGQFQLTTSDVSLFMSGSKYLSSIIGFMILVLLFLTMV